MSKLQYYAALQDFRRARRRADLEQIVGFLKDKPTSLRFYEDVRKKLKTTEAARQTLKEIPLDAIVGSVSRYNDFTRSFLPKRERDKERRTIVEAIVAGAESDFPPIEVYQIGDVYFVSDGNHRVAVARQVGAVVIEAYVAEIAAKISISPDTQPDECILNAEYAEFLTRTHLDDLHPLKDFEITAPGKYHIFEEHIAIYQDFMESEQQRKVRYEEALTRWNDDVYLPLIKIIEDQGILRDFPNRTVADLYLWISEHPSIARQLATTYDEAYVSEIWDNVPTPSEKHHSDEPIINAEYKAFLKHTQFNALRPEANLRVTVPGKYRLLEEHIKIHRHFMGIEQKRKIPYSEAVVHWYDEAYLPLARVIREQHILEDFPERKETDLYLWISEHRAKSQQIDAKRAELYVPEIWTNIRSFSYLRLDELIIKVEYVGFLAHTRLKELRPKADLTVSTPGKYRVFEEHIEVHRYFMGIERQREIPYSEAVAHWYDTVYLPILKIIVEKRMLRDFPDLTAADLYQWILEHQMTLEKEMGQSIGPETAVGNLVNRFGSKKSSPIARTGKKLLDVVTPEKSESETPSAQRRKEILATRRNENLFTDILVPINGRRDGWHVLDQALEIAQREDAHLSGLHVVSSEHQRHSVAILRLKAKFEQRCTSAEVAGELSIEVGDITRKICEHARWTDLVLLHLLHPLTSSGHGLEQIPPDSQALPGLQKEFREIRRHCPSPILALPPKVTPLNNVLLVYDGTQTSNDALFVSAYLAGYWNVSLMVLTEKVDPYTLSFVKSYLKRRGITSTFIQQRGSISESLVKVAEEHQRDFIIIGGYGKHPILEFAFGNPLEHVLETFQVPILLCR